MKKVISFISLLFILYAKIYAQADSVNQNIFNNDSIRYDIAFHTPYMNEMKKNEQAHWRVRIDLSKNQQDFLRSKDSSFWLDHLRNDSPDWATNLLLYCICKKEANMLAYVYNTRKKWMQMKRIEIADWQKFFSSSKYRMKNKR